MWWSWLTGKRRAAAPPPSVPRDAPDLLTELRTLCAIGRLEWHLGGWAFLGHVEVGGARLKGFHVVAPTRAEVLRMAVARAQELLTTGNTPRAKGPSDGT